LKTNNLTYLQILRPATYFTVPVPETHAHNKTAAGIGVFRRRSIVRWVIAKDIVSPWVLALPITGPTEALASKVMRPCA
jgi:PiT family inorganic phosphate transporter